MHDPESEAARVGCSSHNLTMELDKIPGFWVVTGWPDGDVVLRLKIRHNDECEPTHIFCEIRVRPATEFTPLTDFDASIFEMTHPDESDPDFYQELPAIWRAEFAEMARRWAECTFLLSFASSEWSRYPEEPVSSRDAYESDIHIKASDASLRPNQEGPSQA